MKRLIAVVIKNSEEELFFTGENRSSFSSGLVHFEPKFVEECINFNPDKFMEYKHGLHYMLCYNPFLIGSFKQEDVLTFDVKSNKFISTYSKTYGTSFDLLIEKFFNVSKNISKLPDNKISNLKKSKDVKLIKSKIALFGPSYERTLLVQHLRKLEPNKTYYNYHLKDDSKKLNKNEKR